MIKLPTNVWFEMVGSFHGTLWHGLGSWSCNCWIWNDIGRDEVLDSQKLMGIGVGRDGLHQDGKGNYSKTRIVRYRDGGFLPC